LLGDIKLAWSDSENISKFNGKCRNRAKWKYCSYWMAKRSKSTNKIIGYKCSLFDKDKEGPNSLPECNAKYGQTYDGKQII